MPQAFNDFLLPRNFFLLILIRTALNDQVFFTALGKFLVAAGIRIDFLMFDQQDAVANLIQEITVMGNEQNRSAKGTKHLLQIGSDRHVQVVRRLVQKKNIRSAAQHGGKF